MEEQINSLYKAKAVAHEEFVKQFIDEVKQSISKLSHIFQTNPTPIDAEKHPEIEVGIETTGDPVRSKQYMLSPQCKNAVREFVSKLLKLKLIKKGRKKWKRNFYLD